MVEIKGLYKGNQYTDLKNLFPSIMEVDNEKEKYIGLQLIGNHITINGIDYFWENGGFGRAYDEAKKEDARLQLYPNSFELVINGERRIICHPNQITSLSILCKGIFNKDGYNEHYHLKWG